VLKSLHTIVTDTKALSNLQFEVNDYFINVKDKIASNRQEKADGIFPNHHVFSVKTLIAKNTEINMGSFENLLKYPQFFKENQ